MSGDKEELQSEMMITESATPLHQQSLKDDLDIESAKISGATTEMKKKLQGKGGWAVLLPLTFQCIGVVYGDIGTSPLYVFASVFSNGIIRDNDDILGVLSLIFYTITLLPLLKYVFIVLRANDNGQGGSFALYSLICRYAKVGLIPPSQEELEDSNFELELPIGDGVHRASKLKSKLEESMFLKHVLLISTMLATALLIGDGILTPCISVLSATSGIKEAAHSMTQDTVVWISVGILVILFMVQRFGTDKVGNTFAPILLVWFFSIASIGVYNFFRYDPSVVKAMNPMYILDYFRRNKTNAWISLGGVVLCITGAEAMFADLGHFSVRAIQISMSSVIYPSIILAYFGQASFLREHNSFVSTTFYASVPKKLYWPMFLVAVMASVVASQSMLTGTFSIIQQSVSLGCFPRVKIIHTSTKNPGQVYIPEVNYFLMLACIFVTLGFRTTSQIGNAYGTAVVFVMVLTSIFLVLIMILVWKTHILLIILYVLIVGSIELLYLSSVLYKFDQGGYLPLLFAAVMMTIMYVWNYVYRKKYHFELENKISPEKVMEIVQALDESSPRLSGLAIFYSELVHGIPPIFSHYVANVPALHSVFVFVSFKSLETSKVFIEERFFFRRVHPKGLNVFMCVVTYGYTDLRNEEVPFEDLLVEKLKDFIRKETLLMPKEGGHEETLLMPKEGGHEKDIIDQVERELLTGRDEGGDEDEDENKEVVEKEEEHIDEEDKIEEVEKTEKLMIKEEVGDGDEPILDAVIDREIDDLDRAWQSGVVHLVGEHEVVAAKGSNIVKKVLIDYAYNFIKKNLRQTSTVFDIPHQRMLKVGMTYQL